MDGSTNGQPEPFIKQEPSEDVPNTTSNGHTIKEEPLDFRVEVKQEPNVNKKPSEERNAKEEITWPEEDITALLNRIEGALPDKDTLAFNTRVEKLNWSEMAFKQYSGEDCKKTWLLVQKNLRKFRLLGEILKDAREWMTKPWKDRKKKMKFPGMPSRPKSAYMFFYSEKKPQFLQEHPNLDIAEVPKHISQIFKSLPPEDKLKYEKLAADERTIYKAKLEEFYHNHSETSESHSAEVIKKPPKKPSTPFNLFFREHIKTRTPEQDIVIFKEQCRQMWKLMEDTKKIVWINMAVDNETKYKEDLKKYQSKNPGFTPPSFRPILRKEEKMLKERLAGKPLKPPSSAYSLFSRVMLKSEDFKKIPCKDRLKAIAGEWNNYTDEQKRPYQERVAELVEQYKQDYAIYMDTLAAIKRQEDRQATMMKRKSKDKEKDEAPEVKVEAPKKKIKLEPPEPKPERRPERRIERPANGNIFDAEPPEPPISALALFASKYRGEMPIALAWRKLATQKKELLEADVKQMKQQYIEEYERFLKSLTKEELLAFAKMKQAQQKEENQKSASSSKDEDSEHSECSEDEKEQKPVVN